MAKVFQCASMASGETINNVVRYIAVANTGLLPLGSPEFVRIRYKTSGTLSNLGIRVTARNGSGICIIRVQVGGVTLNLSVTIPTSTTGYFEDTDSETIAVDDLLDYRIGCTLGASVTLTAISTTFEADDTDITSIRHAFVNNNNFYDSPDEFYGISDINTTQNTTESNAQVRIATTGTLKNLFIYVSLNNAGGVVVKSRINGADGNMAISTTSTGTGIFEDTSNSDSVVAGDLVNYYINGGADGGLNRINVPVISCEWQSTDKRFHTIFGSSATLGISVTDEYTPLGNSSGNGTTTEASTQMDINGEFTASKLWINRSVLNGRVTLRVNGTDTDVSTDNADNLYSSKLLTSDDDVCLEMSPPTSFYLGSLMLSSEYVKTYIKGNTKILGNVKIMQ